MIILLTVSTACSAVNFCKRFENVANFSVSTSTGGFSDTLAGSLSNAKRVLSFD